MTNNFDTNKVRHEMVHHQIMERRQHLLSLYMFIKELYPSIISRQQCCATNIVYSSELVCIKSFLSVESSLGEEAFAVLQATYMFC